MQWKKGRNKEECSWCERALFPVTCEMRSLETPIHLPNFGQLNKLWEKLYCHCCEGWSFLIELTARFDPVNVIRKKETIAFRGAWVMRQVETPERKNSTKAAGKCHRGTFVPSHCSSFFPLKQRALFYTWIHFIQQLAVSSSSNIFSQQGPLCAHRFKPLSCATTGFLFLLFLCVTENVFIWKLSTCSMYIWSCGRIKREPKLTRHLKLLESFWSTMERKARVRGTGAENPITPVWSF